jgi:hypothetical protein
MREIWIMTEFNIVDKDMKHGERIRSMLVIEKKIEILRFK